MIYLNDIDKCAQAWLAQLYPGASIDGRSIADVKPDDIVGFRRVHFFAGIGGWEYALHLAGVPADMPIWTGSCPCQPFSVAGKGKGEADERHLWPEMRRLISECSPPIVFGEQVASRAGREWLARVRADLEALGYAVGSADLCAAGEGAPHIRQRLYWGAVRLSLTDQQRRDWLNPLLRPWRPGKTDPEAAGSGAVGGLSVSNGGQCNGISGGEGCDTNGQAAGWVKGDCEPECYCKSGGMVNPSRSRSEYRDIRCGDEGVGPGIRRWIDQTDDTSVYGFWSNYDILPFTDRKARRIEPGTFPLVNGLPRGVGYSGDPRLPEYAKATSEARKMRLKGYGNAIVPQVAATFIRAFMESI